MEPGLIAWLVFTYVLGCSAYPGDPYAAKAATAASAPAPAPQPAMPSWLIVCKQINTVTEPARDAAWASAHGYPPGTPKK